MEPQWQETMRKIADDLDNGNFERALQKMEESESLADRSVGRLTDLAELYFQLGHQASAERLADKTLEYDDEKIEALLIKGEIAVQQGKWDEAVGWLEKAHRVEPAHPDVLVALADCYREMGLPEVAVNYLQRLVEEGDPSSPYYLLALGLTQLENGQARAAVETLAMAYELDEQDPDILSTLAQALIEAGQWEESIPYLAEAIRLNPDDTELALTKAVLHYRIGEADEAVEQLRRLADKEPENIDVLAQLGELQLALGRLHDAKDTWESLRRHDPNHIDVFLSLGRIALREQKWQEAVDCFKQAVAAGDERDDVLIGLAEAYQGMEEWSEALRYYEQIGNGADDMHIPAGIYREMARCHVELESFEAAIACLEKELQMTDDAHIRNELADVYWQVGRRNDACACWKRSLELDPNQWEIAELYERNCTDGDDHYH